MLSRADFVPFKKIPKEKADLPDMGGSVLVRQMTTREFLQFGEKSEKAETGAQRLDLMYWLACLTLCDEAGTPLFQATVVDKDGNTLAGDEELLRDSLSKSDFHAIQAKIMQVNGIGEAAAGKSAPPSAEPSST